MVPTVLCTLQTKVLFILPCRFESIVCDYHIKETSALRMDDNYMCIVYKNNS